MRGRRSTGSVHDPASGHPAWCVFAWTLIRDRFARPRTLLLDRSVGSFLIRNRKGPSLDDTVDGTDVVVHLAIRSADDDSVAHCAVVGAKGSKAGNEPVFA